MSNLANQQINASFGSILQVPGGITSTLQTVQDGYGNSTGLQISSTGVTAITASNFTATENGSQIAGAIPRPISDGFGDILNVKDFGAVGDYDPITDSGTDDSAAIQAALNYAGTNFRNGKIFLPTGKYRISTGIIIPNGVFLSGLGGGDGYDGHGTSGGSSIFCDSTVPIAVSLNGGAASISTGIENIFISRRPGSIPSGSTGLKVYSTDNAVISQVLSFNHAIGFHIAGQVGINFLLCNTGSITDTHVLIENTYEIAFTDCRFGRNGGGDVDCNSFVRLTGSGDTMTFLRCQFNQSGGYVDNVFYWDGFSSPSGGIIKIASCHAEGYRYSFIYQTGVGTGVVQRLQIINNVLYSNDSTVPFLAVLPSYLNQLNISSNSIYGALILDQQSQSTVANNFFVGLVTINSGSGSFTGNILYSGLLVEGTFTSSYTVTCNSLQGSSSFVNTATGNVSVLGNITDNSSVNQSLTNAFNTQYLQLLDVPFAIKTYYGVLDGTGACTISFADSEGLILNVQGFYKGTSAEAKSLTFSYGDGANVVFTGGTAGAKYRISIIRSKDFDHNW